MRSLLNNIQRPIVKQISLYIYIYIYIYMKTYCEENNFYWSFVSIYRNNRAL